MALLRYGSASVTHPSITVDNWVDKVYSKVCSDGHCRMKTARSVLAKYDPKKYLLSHCTILAAVDVEPADPKDPKSDYFIRPEYSKFVNNNGDAWTKKMVEASYKTFIGADNFLEHIQLVELSKGKVVDAVLREIPIGKDRKGNDLTTYYVDILVATDRKHDDLVRKIEAGQLATLSMGCGPAGTKVIADSGKFINIEDVEEGDSVISHTGKIKKVTSLFQKDVLNIPLYSVKAVGLYDSLKLTGEHPILIATKESVRCTDNNRPCKIDINQQQCFYNKNLPWKCAGQKRPCGRDKSNHKYDIKFVPISDVKKGDYLIKSFPTEIIDDEIFTKEICRLFGIYLGDGYINWSWKNKEKLNSTGVGFCISLEEEKFKGIILDLLKKVSPDSQITINEVPERNGLYIRVNDSRLSNLFYTYGKEGAWTKEMSTSVMQLPVDKQMEIIGGMFDSDGGFEPKDRNLYYTTASESLWNQLHLLLLRAHIPNAQERCWRKATGKKAGQKNYWQMTINIQKGSNSVIDTWKNENYGKESEFKNDLCFFYKNYYLSPIRQVSYSDFSGKVYNFSVEEDESYLINNMAVHNCKISYSICSKCGNKAVDESQACQHVRYEKGNTFYDENGTPRKVAELCGDYRDPDSVVFVDASWVANPAFTGAVLRNTLEPTSDIEAKIEAAHKNDHYKVKADDLLKVANKKTAQDPPAEDAPVDAPAEDVPADAADAPTDTSTDAPADEAAPAEDTALPEEDTTPQNDSKTWRDQIKKKILDSIGDEIVKDLSDTGDEGMQAPRELETLDETLIRPASLVLKKVWGAKLGWDRYLRQTANNLDDKNFKKLRLGTQVLMTSNDPKALKDIGFSKRDFLAIMSYMDDQFKSPLPVQMKKIIAEMGGTSGYTPIQALSHIVTRIGRKITASEGRKSLVWLKLLDRFETC